jgi:hypothetical protein
MFSITPNPTFTTDVELHVAGAEPGKIKVTFKYLNKEQLVAWQKDYGNKPAGEALQAIITDWQGVQLEDGTQAPYSPDALNQLLAGYQTAAQDIANGFLREILGARRKN